MHSFDPLHYHAFLLRVWREQHDAADGNEAWRFSLEDPRTGARRGFGSLHDLVVFLELLVHEDSDTPGEIDT